MPAYFETPNGTTTSTPSWPVGLSSRIRALHLMLMILLGVFTTPTHKTRPYGNLNKHT